MRGRDQIERRVVAGRDDGRAQTGGNGVHDAKESAGKGFLLLWGATRATRSFQWLFNEFQGYRNSSSPKKEGGGGGEETLMAPAAKI